MAEAEARRRSRGGGGAARRAERTAVSVETAGYIQRNIPNFEILNDEALDIIETNAETVVAEIGVNFVNNPAALDRWREAGAEVTGERVRIPVAWRASCAAPRPRPLPSTRATRPGRSRSVAGTLCWHLSTAHPSCMTPPAAAAMPPWPISRNS